MQRNYNPNPEKVSMLSNDIKVDGHKSINEQIDEFFQTGGRVNEVAPNVSGLPSKPSKQFTISAERNAARKEKEEKEAAQCS